LRRLRRCAAGRRERRTAGTARRVRRVGPVRRALAAARRVEARQARWARRRNRQARRRTGPGPWHTGAWALRGQRRRRDHVTRLVSATSTPRRHWRPVEAVGGPAPADNPWPL